MPNSTGDTIRSGNRYGGAEFSTRKSRQQGGIFNRFNELDGLEDEPGGDHELQQGVSKRSTTISVREGLQGDSENQTIGKPSCDNLISHSNSAEEENIVTVVRKQAVRTEIAEKGTELEQAGSRKCPETANNRELEEGQPYGGRKHDTSTESNWDRLEDLESQGLLMALLKMKKSESDVLASILEAHPLSPQDLPMELELGNIGMQCNNNNNEEALPSGQGPRSAKEDSVLPFIVF